MEGWEVRNTERRIMNGRIHKSGERKLLLIGKMRKLEKRREFFKEVSKTRYTTVSEEMIDLYERTFGKPKQFNQLHLNDPESYFKEFKKPTLQDPESYYRYLRRDKDDKDKSKKSNITASSNSHLLLKQSDKGLNNIKPKEQASPTLYIPTLSNSKFSSPLVLSPASSKSSYFDFELPIPSKSNLDLKERSISSKSSRDLKEKPISSKLSLDVKEEQTLTLAKTIIQQSCYTYYNTETLEQINSFEPLDSKKYNELNSWKIIKSKVSVPRYVSSKSKRPLVLAPRPILCWTYVNKRTHDQRISFQKLEKTEEEVEFCEPIIVPQFDEHPEEISIEPEFKIDIQEDVRKEIKRIEKENREFATEEEIKEESQCLENVKEMGVQDAIKHIKEENKNDDNLKAYICHELSLKSPRYNSNAMNKKRSATRRLQDWIQYDKYPSLELEQAEKLVIMLNTGSKVLVDGDKISVRGNDLITLKKRGWLNDEVINFYIELILKRSASEPTKYPKIYMFNTFFYSLLEKKGYSGVSRITKKAKVDIFSLDMVIVPIHLHIHWALAVINIKERRLEYYDSMSKGYNTAVLSLLKHYVEEEYKDKKKASSYDMSDWEYYRVENLPQQTNAYDCGVFAMTFAEHISRGASVLFVPPKHMKYFRLKMMWEIINSKLLPVDQQHSVNVKPDGVLEPVVKRSNGSNGINNHINSINSFGSKRTLGGFSTFI